MDMDIYFPSYKRVFSVCILGFLPSGFFFLCDYLHSLIHSFVPFKITNRDRRHIQLFVDDILLTTFLHECFLYWILGSHRTIFSYSQTVLKALTTKLSLKH